MLQFSTYSVISPEGCASILWKSADKAAAAAEAMGITADRLKKLDLVDEILPEPVGAAHRHVDEMAKTIKKSLKKTLNELTTMTRTKLVSARYDRLMQFGVFEEK
ncbi:MAG: acetyl-CoA carboxylase carboxyl transferase subunit alpha, partial [Acidiferrobacterales bacterium]|nr:acetyl-CoA carboxylase carboxyl transferase subunit alpha [Acidiferrobacterales bacterium]